MTDTSATDPAALPSTKSLFLQKSIGVGGWLLLLLCAICLVAIVQSTVRYAPFPGNDMLVLSLIVGGTFAYLNTRRGRPAWNGFVLGLLVGVPLSLAPEVSSRILGTRLINGLQSSLSSFDPAAAAKLRSVPANSAAFRHELDLAVVHAIRRAPDTAVIAFYTSYLRIAAPPTEAHRCASVARGEGFGSVDIDTGTGIMTAVMNLFRAAGESSGPPPVFDADTARAELVAVATKAAPGGELNSVSKFKGLSDSTQCGIYLGLMRGIYSLPTADAAEVLRYMSSSNVH